MRPTLIIACALVLDASLAERASAAQACAWIVETLEDDGGHMFELSLSVDAPTSVSVRFQGPGFTSASVGGDLIPLEAGKPQVVDGAGFDVSAGDDLSFDVQLFNRPLASIDEMRRPTATPLARFAFHRKVGEEERTPPGDLASKQCKRLG